MFLQYFSFCTVKHSYNRHSYNKLILTAKWFSLPMTLLYVVNLSHITKHAYNKVKWLIACPWHFVINMFYCIFIYIGPQKDELPDLWTGPGGLCRTDQTHQVFHPRLQSKQSHCIWRFLWRNAGCMVPYEISKCSARVKKKLKSSKQAYFNWLNKLIFWLLLVLHKVAQI